MVLTVGMLLQKDTTAVSMERAKLRRERDVWQIEVDPRLCGHVCESKRGEQWFG